MLICFYIFQLNYRQIFCASYSLVLVDILELLLTSFTSNLFFKFPIALPYIALFINLWNAFPFYHYFFLLLFIYLFICFFIAFNTLFNYNMQ